MPQSLSLPFQIAQLRLSTGETLSFPIADANAFRLEAAKDELAQKFAASLQESQLEKGEHFTLLDLVQANGFSLTKITVPFPAAPDGISYPDFSLEFDAVLQERGEQIWGMVPALGIASLSPKLEDLEKNLVEAVRIEFSAKRRLQSVFQIIASNWYDNVEITQTTLKVKAFSPTELVEIQKHKKKEILGKVAQKMVVDSPMAFGREQELAQMERVLKGRFGRNLLLVGASGVGKTVLVQELAHKRVSLDIETEIWETSASILIKELTNETGWQDNLSSLIAELTQTGHVLFVGNLAELFEVGRYEGNSVSVAEYLRTAIGRGQVTLIAECTPEERARIELRSPGYLSFFQTIEIAEPKQGMESIILNKVKSISNQHGVGISSEAVQEAIRLSRRFMPYSGLPGMPIRFLESILLGLSEAQEPKKNQRTKPIESPSTGLPQKWIDKPQIMDRFCEDSGLPPFIVNPAIPMDAFLLRKTFNTQVFGQEQAVSAIVDMLATVKTALSRSGKPIASFLFAGPTGVGKTEMAKVLAQIMFGNRDRMVRFDMSEYSNPWAVMRLIGETYQSNGLLTSAVRRSPFCVLLFDEIEKADPKFFELLLQVLGEGRLTDSRGQVVNFCSTIIIMTTNIGASNLFQNRISWKKEIGDLDFRQHFVSSIEKHFRPELYNRIDAIVAFAPLDKETMRYVVEREVELLKAREGIRRRPINLTIEEAVYEHLSSAGYDAKFGARHLQRTIREELAIPLAKALNAYAFDERLFVRIFHADGKIQVETESDPAAFELLMEKWDNLTLAEKSSHLRRKLTLLMESPLFLRFQGDLELLQQDKKKQKGGHFPEAGKAKLFASMSAANAQVNELLEQIQDMEMEIALHCMGQDLLGENFSDQLEAWEDALFELQKKLHSLIFPKRNSCRLSFFGTKLNAVVQFYAALISSKQFGLRSIDTIWYREGYKPTELSEQGKNETDYIKKRVNVNFLEQFAPVPPQPTDILCGIEMELEGDCIWLYLKEEKGIQAFVEKDGPEELLIYVQPALNKSKVPGEVHRQSFYTNSKPRRKITPSLFVDSKYGIQGNLVPNKSPEALLAKLDEMFKEAVNRAFLNIDPDE